VSRNRNERQQHLLWLTPTVLNQENLGWLRLPLPTLQRVAADLVLRKKNLPL